MIHLRARILSSLVHYPPRIPASRVSPLFALHRNLSATTCTAASPFAAEDYLVATCGVTRAQALKASKKISHLKSSSKPDAVLAFLSGLGVPRSDVATLVAVDPRFLCASVERTLAPRVTELRELGLSRSQIAGLVPLALCSFRSSSLSRNLDFWLSVFGSYDKLLKALRMNSGLLAADLDKVAKPNLALLQQCGLSPSLFSEPFISRVLVRTPQQVQDALVHIDKFGVSQDSRMFLYALVAFTVQSPEKLTDKIQILESLGWSKDDVLLAVKKMPGILTVSEERLQRNMHFLTEVAGLEIPYICSSIASSAVCFLGTACLSYSTPRGCWISGSITTPPRYPRRSFSPSLCILTRRVFQALLMFMLLAVPRRKYRWSCYRRRRSRECAKCHACPGFVP